MVLWQNLGKIRSNVVKKVKKGIIKFFFIFYMGNIYLLKQKEVIVQTPEWKFKAKIARNAIFESC